jgi:hypothetical protein
MSGTVVTGIEDCAIDEESACAEYNFSWRERMADARSESIFIIISDNDLKDSA